MEINRKLSRLSFFIFFTIIYCSGLCYGETYLKESLRVYDELGFDAGVGLRGFTFTSATMPGIGGSVLNIFGANTFSFFYRINRENLRLILKLFYADGDLRTDSFWANGKENYYPLRAKNLCVGVLLPYYYKEKFYVALGIDYYFLTMDYRIWNISYTGNIPSGQTNYTYTSKSVNNDIGWQIQWGWENNKYFFPKITIKNYVTYIEGMRIVPSGIFFTIGWKFSINRTN